MKETEITCGCCGRTIYNPIWKQRYETEALAEICEDCYGVMKYDLDRLITMWTANTGQTQSFISRALYETLKELVDEYGF